MPKKTAAPKQVHDLDLANRLLDGFGRIVAALSTPQLSYDQRLSRILTSILDYLGVEQGSIMVVEKKRELVVRAATRTELIGHTQRLDNGSIAAWVARHREPLFVPDIAKDERFQGQYRQHYKKNALLSVPIIHKEKVIGIINVTDKAGEKNLLKEDVTRLLDFTGLVLSLLVQQSLQEEVKKQRDTLRQRNQELQRQQAMRAELSKLLIHDLKGPLSEVVANLDILSYSIHDGEQQEFLEAAQIGCNRAVRMVANLGTIDKIEDGRLSLIRETVDPKVILEESMSSMRGLARIKDIGISLVIPDEELPPVELDRILILRVMQNLLTNALGYSPAGTTISFGCRRGRGRSLEFFVEDQGVGIPPEKRSAIFEKYARISDKQDALVGTGLGLYFCRLAVELHRGRIGVENAPAGGSRFFFTLPL